MGAVQLPYDVGRKVIMKVLADAWKIGRYRDALLLEVTGRTDSRQHEEFRRPDRPRRHDQFLRLNAPQLTALGNLDSNRPSLLNDDAGDKSAGLDREIAPLASRPQIAD